MKNKKMKKINKVISLKLAKELKEIASINNFDLPESEYWWDIKNDILTDNRAREDKSGYISALDVCELGEILPKGFYSVRDYNFNPNWICWKFDEGNEKSEYKEISKISEAEVRGKMLYFLIKNKLI